MRIIPGHGELTDKEGLQEYATMLHYTLALMEQRISEGMDQSAAVKAGMMDLYDDWSWELHQHRPLAADRLQGTGGRVKPAIAVLLLAAGAGACAPPFLREAHAPTSLNFGVLVWEDIEFAGSVPRGQRRRGHPPSTAPA